MNLERLLDKSKRLQWSLHDLDFSQPPRAMSTEDEMAVVQYLTDLVYIERMAGAFFQAQLATTPNETVAALLRQFVEDETRHAQAMQMLADYYDRRKLRVYSGNPHLVRLTRLLHQWILVAPPDMAATAVALGEIVFDVAYVKPLEDYLADKTATQVLKLVNRDESRHIALDCWMVDYYGSDAWEQARHTLPRRSAEEWARLSVRFTKAFLSGAPFMRSVFFGQNGHVDPSGARLEEAIRRIQIVILRRGISERPFARFYRRSQQLLDSPLIGRALRELLAFGFGTNQAMFKQLCTADELRRYDRLDSESLARDTIAAFA